MRSEPTSKLSAGAAALASVLSAAHAGECPAEHVRPDADLIGPEANDGVTVVNRAAVSLGEATGLDGVLQERVVTIAPGGVLQLHAHDAVPGYARVLLGSALEHRSDCAVPIRRTEGDLATEPHTLTHWWHNDGDVPFVLHVSHVVPAGD